MQRTKVSNVKTARAAEKRSALDEEILRLSGDGKFNKKESPQETSLFQLESTASETLPKKRNLADLMKSRLTSFNNERKF